MAGGLSAPVSFSKFTQLKTHYNVCMDVMGPPFCSVKVKNRNHNGFGTLEVSSFPWEGTEAEPKSIYLHLSTIISGVCLCVCMCVLAHTCVHVWMEASDHPPP